MELINKKTRSIWGIAAVGMVILSYLLVRFALFDLHGMKEWPNMLAIFSIAVIVMASILKKRLIFIGVVFGYLVGFAVAMIFSTSGLDAGGGATNNAWIIWTVFLLFSIAVSIIQSYRKKKN